MPHTLAFDVLHSYAGDVGITVPLALRVGKSSLRVLAKVDTGATVCIFQREHGEDLGLKVEAC